VADQPALRDATLDDVESIGDLWLRSAEESFRPLLPDGFELPPRNIVHARLRAGILQHRDVAMILAERDETLVGYVAAGPTRDPDALTPTGEIWSIFVEPGAWGRGVGRVLMEAARDRLDSAGLGELTVWSFRDNERANAFYERHGFKRDGAEKRMAEWDYIPIVRYRHYTF
jgi:GNAT superfamily N-acetyltransferase